MKKSNRIIYLLFLFVLGVSMMSCRDDDDDNPFNPNDSSLAKISFVSNLANEEIIDFDINSKDYVEVDFGDGKKIKYEKPSNSNEIKISSKVKGKEIKIYAPNANSITKFEANNMKIASIDVKNAIELDNLDLYKNELTSLDISKNTKLTYIDYSINKIKQSANNAILNALPKRVEADNAVVWAYDNYNNTEQNDKPTQQAIDAAVAKFWNVNIDDYDNGKSVRSIQHR
ncbi:hypothetical protein G6R40_04610 [Chryseobacterium sp. POL2]|uniref:hypothetical protein n=1 Tax=Chryseobacterium sp. POL2 TaxID=2713414 RepID=UPI0013E14E8C|nr:hypothetical protein [Chryseobacterium sp. POL2]QIG88992.1 hypothetical protein G6R40_04610 [Chryseobacterium sp. POL2]